jgi:hypothetical protein
MINLILEVGKKYKAANTGFIVEITTCEGIIPTDTTGGTYIVYRGWYTDNIDVPYKYAGLYAQNGSAIPGFVSDKGYMSQDSLVEEYIDTQPNL